MTTHRTLTHEGVTMTISEWAARTKQSPQNIRYRLDRGWTVTDALYVPCGTLGRSPHAKTIQAERQRCQRELKAQTARMTREFEKLVADVNRALRGFSNRLALIANDHDRGMGSDQHGIASDRSSRNAPESL